MSSAKPRDFGVRTRHSFIVAAIGLGSLFFAAPPASAEPIHVYFNFQSTTIQQSADALIGIVKQMFKPGNKVRIIGHADKIEGVAIAKARADAVKVALVHQGIPASAMSVAAAGPVVKMKPGEKDPHNRVVDISVR